MLAAVVSFGHQKSKHECSPVLIKLADENKTEDSIAKTEDQEKNVIQDEDADIEDTDHRKEYCTRNYYAMVAS